MKDAIDKRNEKEKIARSIIKRWNVIYITKEELEKRRQEEERMKQNQEECEKADEILKRLENEAKEDECKKAEEMQAILAQQEIEGHKNADTYGTTPMDGVTQEKVEAILNDKERMLQQIIQDTEMASAQQEMEENVGEELTEDNTTAEEKDAEEVSEVVEESEEEGASA
ncbi:hypothetical protein [Roseburia sp. MSJ-14]|uniref:hypothetical protein n=1 Tax=Roseburia sp. MSJ-14 TaxID=2841514 RepID=UPI001C1122D3|nr:hypothetical protein [Roseburia sp. MSJ-14]MBU5472307.1 hypothetical protein [Roseburia sp. MSJ-14]